MSFPHINLKKQKAHTNDLTPLFMYGFSQQSLKKKKKSIAISRQQEKKKKKNTPGLHIDKSSIVEPLSFLSFKKGMTVEIQKQFIFTKRKCISPQNASFFLIIKNECLTTAMCEAPLPN